MIPSHAAEPDDWKIVRRSETRYVNGDAFGVQILVKQHPDHELTDAEDCALIEAQELLEKAFGQERVARDSIRQDAARRERAELLGLFQQPIYVETLPNGYCLKWCCSHLPWFRVTTEIGPIVIGWRKRVISIDWSGSLRTELAEALFPDERVTKDGRLIHAWSIEDAKRYLDVLFSGVGR